ncbi:hypothetical protein BX600DRAFT_505859 [Xylariales sp. PMI_506]|nr:hypothetical protein BX600DRAFT_505859 [Xylariales sp. PMI_506]
MAILNNAFAEGAYAVARAVEVHARQATTTAVSSVVSSALSSATSVLSDATITSASSTTTGDPTFSPSPTSTANNNNNNGGNSQSSSGTSSPLLFFVALGFGVVFTNLWIIVGVKYCFRYNARNRQLRGLDENGEPINLENMPTRPHRRRREKKLMTMDEVNEKFPMMKYKAWVADRAKDGLPTAGGVSAPASRANSVRSVEGIVPEIISKEQPSVDNVIKPQEQANAVATEIAVTSPQVTEEDALTRTRTAGSVITKDPDHVHGSDDEDDDDDHINAAVPPELLATSGDTCAICIDTLEDDDDVRGLTCGHAFHAVCLDPWLTNRRACCPLCKADYYTPKPRPPPVEGDPNNPTSPNAADPSRNNGRLNMPRQPQRALGGWGWRESPRAVFGRHGVSNNNDAHGRPRRSDRDRRRQGQSRATSHASRPTRNPSVPAPESSLEQGFLGRIRSRLPRLGRNEAADNSGTPATADPATTTPSQLEAGARAPN